MPRIATLSGGLLLSGSNFKFGDISRLSTCICRCLVVVSVFRSGACLWSSFCAAWRRGPRREAALVMPRAEQQTETNCYFFTQNNHLQRCYNLFSLRLLL